MQITTERLILRAASEALLKAEVAFIRDSSHRNAFEQAIGAQLLTWPPLYNDETTCSYMLEMLTANPDHAGWWQWYVLLKREQDIPLLVASAGFHGPRDADDTVEIGYSVIKPYQRRGIATETVKALTGWAFSFTEIAQVIITTLDKPELVPSTKVAQKCGYRYAGKHESDEGTLLVFVLSREEYSQGSGK